MYDDNDMDELEDSYEGDREPRNSRYPKVPYPPRLLVDFNKLQMPALKRYAAFYNLNASDQEDKSELAALVARHFDCSLEVEEDESIVSFMKRVRNGEKSSVKHRPAEKGGRKSARKPRDRDRDHSTASTRKRGRDISVPHERKNPSSRVNRSPPDSPPKIVNGSNSNASNSRKSSKKQQPQSPRQSQSQSSPTADEELYCICSRPSFGNMIACDGKTCPNPSQWYHLACVGYSDGQHPDVWLCPECDPRSAARVRGEHSKRKDKKRRGTVTKS